MAESKSAPAAENRLRPELMAEVCRALDFDPAEFARRHAEEFTRQYMRADGMLKGVGDGEEIVLYLARRVNECLSRAEYALLSYIEYAGRSPQAGETDGFNDAVARYLRAREKNGVDWLYLFERESAKTPCLEVYPRMYAAAHAMYDFILETEEFKEVSWSDGPNTWPNPSKMQKNKTAPPE